MSKSDFETDILYSSLGADPDLSDLVEDFVGALPQRVVKLRERFDETDWVGLATLAHQIKGAAGSYGFDQLTPYAASLEQAARSAEEAEIRISLAELIRLCSRLRAGAPA